MSAIGGYASRNYEHIEDLAETADWIGRNSDGYDKAISDYVKALNAIAATRTALEPREEHDPYARRPRGSFTKTPTEKQRTARKPVRRTRTTAA